MSFAATETNDNLCPVCAKPLTIGVAHRVEQLANRSITEAAKQVQSFQYVLPLPEIFAEITGFNEDSKKVANVYTKAISHFGNEFNILRQVPLNDIQRYNHKLSIAIDRLRSDKKHFTAGYDGERGHIYFFDKAELQDKPEQLDLFYEGEFGKERLVGRKTLNTNIFSCVEREQFIYLRQWI